MNTIKNIKIELGILDCKFLVEILPSIVSELIRNIYLCLKDEGVKNDVKKDISYLSELLKEKCKDKYIRNHAERLLNEALSNDNEFFKILNVDEKAFNLDYISQMKNIIKVSALSLMK